MASIINNLRGGGLKSEADDNAIERNSDGDSSQQQPHAMTAIDGTATTEVNKDAQIGVQEMEATTLVWSKPMLICYFVW